MSLRVHTYWRGLRICAQCSGPMDGCRADAEVCSGTCGRARRRRREGVRVAAGRVNGRVRSRLVAEGGVVAAERERARLAKRVSRNPASDVDLLYRTKQEVASTAVLNGNENDLAELAKLGGRVQKLARRLLARARYLELYGEAP